MIINVFYEITDCRDDAFVSCFPIRMFFWIFLSTTVSGFIRKKQMTNNCFWSCKKTFVFLQLHFLSGIFTLCATERFRFVVCPFSPHNP